MHVGVRAARHKTGAERVLKHIGGTAGVLADNYLCLFVHIGAEIPAQEAADLYGVIKGEVFVGFASEAVGSEILSHQSAFLSITTPLFLKMQFSGTTPRTQEVG